MTPRSWLEISVSQLRHNLNAVRSRLGDRTTLMPVLKADAYGHGLARIGKILGDQGVSSFAVARPDEGMELRRVLPASEILVLSGCQDREARAFVEHQLIAALIDARPAPPGVSVEVKIDTGMTRMGIPWDSAEGLVDAPESNVSGVFSHFARAESDAEFSRLQLQRLLYATAGLRKRRHICNSAGLRFPEAHLDLVRVGLALYGVAPCAGFEDLRPVLRWKSRLLTQRRVKAREWIGYGSSFQAQRESKIGVVPVGYADGYPRRLSNRASMLVRGNPAAVVGRVSMDVTSIDVTSIPGVEPGTEVEILSSDPNSPLSCAALADLAETIPYEIFTGIGHRVERRYLD